MATQQIEMFPKIGDNVGPLILLDSLPEQTAELRARAEALREQALKAQANDKDGVDKCVLLAGLIREHIAGIDKERTEVKKPWLEGCREIDAHYHDIEALLVQYDAKRRPIGGPLWDVIRLVDAYRREQERLAQERQRELEEEARQARLKAEEEERKRREAELAMLQAQEAADQEVARRQVAEAQLESERLQRRADALEKIAEVQQAGPIKTAYGVSARRRPIYNVVINDLTLALRHARKINEAAVRNFVQTLYEAQVRAGVRTLPGATITEDSATTIRLR